MATSKKPTTTTTLAPPPPPAPPSALNITGAQLIPLAPVIKAMGLPLVDPATGKDFTNAVLTYSGGSVKSKANLAAGLFYFAGQYPAAGNYLLAKFGLQPGMKPPSGWDSIVWDSLQESKMNLYTAVPPVSQAYKNEIANKNATIASLQNNLNYGIAAGVSSVTASQQANAIDNIQNTIETWYGAAYPLMTQFLTNAMTALITTEGDHLINHYSLLDVLRGEVQPVGMSNAVHNQILADYETAFPGLKQYNNNPKNNVKKSETQYQQYVSTIVDASGQYGAPVPTPSQIGIILNNHVSATEYTQRLQDVYSQVMTADAGTLALLQKEFGINHNDIMAYMLTGETPKDKTKLGLPQMQRQIATAEIQNYANSVGYTGLQLSGAENLADMAKLASTAGNQDLAYGVNQIEQSMLSGARDASLVKSLPGAQTPNISTDAILASQLPGYGNISQVTAQTEVARAEQARTAPFEKGGGYEETQKGVTGIGTART